MRRILATAAFALMLLSVSANGSQDYMAQFEKFKRDFQRVYSSPEEEAVRFKAFVASMKENEAFSKANPLATFGVTRFADMTMEEFKMSKTETAASFREAVRRQSGSSISPADDLRFRRTMNQTVDWRTRGVVTPIKNQLGCGGCWAFSTTGNIEGQWAIAGNGLVSLSEQELISCDDTCNNCHGGNYVEAWQWIINARGGGITSESQDPFVSGSGYVPSCSLQGKTSVAFIQNYVEIPHSEESMAAYVSANGPISIAVDATSLKGYTGGVLTNCASNQVDHAILVVGYDLTASPPYWIIKNQWGTSWGIEGYLHLAYGSDQCLITTLPASSQVGANPPPVPPTGPPGPTPPPTNPPNGTFTQDVCTDSACSVGCQATNFPTGECIPTSSGGSVVAACGANNLHFNFYQSTNCTGSFTPQANPLNQCSQAGSNYIEYTCQNHGGGSSSSGLEAAVLMV